MSRAVSGVNLSITQGETLGLVGESGSGKSLTALTIAGLQPRPVAEIASGSIELNGQQLVGLSERQLRRVRGAHVSMILQDPMTALNPVMTIGRQIEEPLKLHQHMNRRARRARAIELLELLQIRDAPNRIRAYPHQLSGGMCQRVVGAIALACSPELLIADEPTTALDVTAQAAYLALLKSIQQERGFGVLFITHDFGAVRRTCDRVAVMYAGSLVEAGTVEDILQAPRHPYTHALIQSVPDIRQARQRPISIPGRPPLPSERPAGCSFHPRCWLFQQLGRPDRCMTVAPEPISTNTSEVACHFANEVLGATATQHESRSE